MLPVIPAMGSDLDDRPEPSQVALRGRGGGDAELRQDHRSHHRDDAGLVYVSTLGREIRVVLMSHDCPVAQLTDATTITHKSVALQ